MPGPTRKPGPGPWRFGGRRTADIETPQQPLPYYIEDAWDWSEDNTWATFHADSYQQQDATQLQDFGAEQWDWDTESHDYDDTTDLAAIDSAPVGPDAIPLQNQDEYFDQWEENYEDPQVPDFEWSGPIQPNAPPPPPEDAWDWSDESYLGPDFGVDSYLQADVLGTPNTAPLPADEWDWFAPDDHEEFAPPDELPQVLALVLQPPEDGWDWASDESGGPDFVVDSYLQSDAIAPPPTAAPGPEDAWDWGTDDYLGPDVGVDSYLQSDAAAGPTTAVPGPEDAWDWSDEGYLGPDVGVDSYLQADAPPPPTSPAQPSDDLEALTYEDEPEDFFADHFGNADAPDVPAIADPWDYDTEQGEPDDWYTQDNPTPADVFPPPATQQPEEQWDDSQDDVEDDLVDHFTNYDAPAAPAIEDAWDWDGDQAADDDWYTPESPTPPDVFAVPPMPPDDGWDWGTDYEQTDDYETDQYTLTTFTFVPLTVEDAWDWEADSAYDDDALWIIDTAQPTGPNAPVVTTVIRMVRRAHVFVTQDK